jgi:hypothetical protein
MPKKSNPRRKTKLAEPKVIVIGARTPPAVVRREANCLAGYFLGVADKHHGFDNLSDAFDDFFEEP